MNKIYRVIWNATLGLWQCVSELSKSNRSLNKDKSSVIKVVTFSSFILISQNVWSAGYVKNTSSAGNGIKKDASGLNLFIGSNEKPSYLEVIDVESQTDFKAALRKKWGGIYGSWDYATVGIASGSGTQYNIVRRRSFLHKRALYFA